MMNICTEFQKLNHRNIKTCFDFSGTLTYHYHNLHEIILKKTTDPYFINHNHY